MWIFPFLEAARATPDRTLPRIGFARRASEGRLVAAKSFHFRCLVLLHAMRKFGARIAEAGEPANL